MVQLFQNGFQKQEMELSKEEMESFLPFAVIGSKNFFNKRFLVQSNDSKMVFINRKWNYLNRKWNYLSPFQLLYPKSSLTKDSSFQLFQNGFQKQDNELSKQATESFSHVRSLDQKTHLTKDSKMVVINMKWNYLNRKWN